MRMLYPEIQAYKTGFLKVDEIHSIYWEISGNPQGKPILFLHGGPGSGTAPIHRQFFDPKIYQIILLDQRGCGKSTPHAELKNNTTWDLVEDIEKLRKLLKIDRWVVFGGSWGSTLSLTYAIQHASSVKGLILRGVFLSRKKELQWFYQQGADFIFPDAWEKFISPIPLEERNHLIEAYHQRLTSADPVECLKAVEAWSSWEAVTSKLILDPQLFQDFTEKERAFAISQIECHYFFHHSFFPSDNWILENISKIQKIPGMIVQGRYDMICPMTSAWELHKAWPESQLVVIPNAGHSSMEEGTIDALVKATDDFSKL
jgi:proline iminopeptidase